MTRNDSHVLIPLSKLIPSRRNVRRVKPERDAHRRLVASVKAHGLLEPLVVRPTGGGKFSVIAGNGRLAALREVHKGADPKIPCHLRAVDDDTADALSLTENFARSALHPLDEAEAFAKLAGTDGKNAAAIAADFGVTPGYVRQRMKLATLADVVKAAYRDGAIDTATAEAFAAVPPDRQEQVWEEVGGRPRHAEHVKSVIANGWIDAAHALFDVSILPEGTVSRDLFGDKILVERKVFLSAQAEALAAAKQALTEDGFAAVVVGEQADVQDRLWAMDPAPPQYDDATTAALHKLHRRRATWERKLEGLDEGDEDKAEVIQGKVDELDDAEGRLLKGATVTLSEDTKAVATAFLLLDPDGRVRREYRVPRPRPRYHGDGVELRRGDDFPPLPPEAPKVPTSADLKDGQRATAFTHQCLAVRQALLDSPLARKRILVLALHERVRKDGLALRPEANSTTLHAGNVEGFTSPAGDALRTRREGLDPFAGNFSLEDDDAYAQLADVSEELLDDLIAILTVETVTAALHRPTPLVRRLAKELGADVRTDWRPDAPWLAAYQKAQLAHLVCELKGSVHAPAPDRKKGELVASLASLFADAADGKLDDPKLAARVNEWLPANLRDDPPADPLMPVGRKDAA